MRHLQEIDLALYATGELPQGWTHQWAKFRAGLHVRNCADCGERVTAYRLDREMLRTEFHSGAMPEGVNWDRLAREMTANIHLGLAAGECVAPAQPEGPGLLGGMMAGWNWRPAAAVACLSAVMLTASWLNLPVSDLTQLGQALDRLVHGKAGVVADRGSVVYASSDGIEVKGGGSVLGLSSGSAPPVMVQASFNGSASARFVDDDSQVAIVTVYSK